MSNKMDEMMKQAAKDERIVVRSILTGLILTAISVLAMIVYSIIKLTQ